MRNVKDHVSSVEINHLVLDVVTLLSEGHNIEMLKCIKKMASLYDDNGDYDKYVCYQKKLYEHMVMMKLGMNH